MRRLLTLTLLPVTLVLAAGAITIVRFHLADAGTAARADAVIRSVRLTSTVFGQRSQTQGGEVRDYRLRRARAGDLSGGRTYRVFTANGGCVHDVQTAG
jgi:hypothetical protein